MMPGYLTSHWPKKRKKIKLDSLLNSYVLVTRDSCITYPLYCK